MSSSSLTDTHWDEGPCYICGKNVLPSEGWHREDHDCTRRHWCKAHRPAWSWGDRECIQHGYDYSAICPICGPWWHEQATVYDHERNQWSPQCPYGDVCTGCDAAGKCARAPVKAQLPDDGAAWRSSWRWPDGSTRYA